MQKAQLMHNKMLLIIAVTHFFIRVLITQVQNGYLIFQIEINKNTSFGKYHIIHGLVLMITRHQLLKENKTTNFELLRLLLSEVLHAC